MERDARAFVAELERLEDGASARDILALAQRYARYNVPTYTSCADGRCDPQPCTDDFCSVEFVFHNHEFSRFLLARPFTFWPSVTVQNGRLYSIAWSARSNLGRSELVVGVQDNRVSGFTGNRPRLESSRRANVRYESVILPPEVGHGHRRRAYALTIECFSRWGGCKAVEEILPAVALWRASAAK